MQIPGVLQRVDWKDWGIFVEWWMMQGGCWQWVEGFGWKSRDELNMGILQYLARSLHRNTYNMLDISGDLRLQISKGGKYQIWGERYLPGTCSFPDPVPPSPILSSFCYCCIKCRSETITPASPLNSILFSLSFQSILLQSISVLLMLFSWQFWWELRD